MIKRVLLALLLCSITACEQAPNEPILSTKECQLTVFVHLSTRQVVNARAIVEGSIPDNEIKTVDLLLFDRDTKLYLTKALSGTLEEVSLMVKKFTVTIPSGGMDLVFVANSREMINQATLPANKPKTKSKTEFHDLMFKTLPDKSANPLTGIWNAQPNSDGYEPFPMWSEITYTIIPEEDVELNVLMIRMLAKINLIFDSQAVSDKLKLESVMLCNFNKSGYVTSDSWRLSIADGLPQPEVSEDEKRSRSLGVENGIVYANTDQFPTVITTLDGIQTMKDELFLFDIRKSSATPTETQRKEALCLIVKGKYNGSPTDSYYRIDFVNTSGELMTLLRNHVYDVVIKNVNTAGFATAQEAYDSSSTTYAPQYSPLNVEVSSISSY